MSDFNNVNRLAESKPLLCQLCIFTKLISNADSQVDAVYVMGYTINDIAIEEMYTAKQFELAKFDHWQPVTTRFHHAIIIDKL